MDALLTAGEWSHLRNACGSATAEPWSELLARSQVCDRKCLSVLKMAEKQYLSSAAAEPLLQAEGFADQVRTFLARCPAPRPEPTDADAAPTRRSVPADAPSTLPDAPSPTSAFEASSRADAWGPPRVSAGAAAPESVDDASSALLDTSDVSVLELVEALPELLPPGTRLGKYAIERLLGRGGFGAVYLSTHPTLRVPVAVKVLRTLGTPAARDAFRNEARMAAQLNDPAIVRVWDFDEDDHRRPYLVMEFVDGSTFGDLLRRSGRCPIPAALAVVRTAAQALKAAARLGIVHKDIKPANILIARDGAVKLTDFGVAAVQDQALRTHLSIRLPSERLVSGTIEYMPPEQAQGGEVDIRSDIYALGVTFYQAVTGRLPFAGGNAARILVKQMLETPRPPADCVPEISRSLSDLILKMMARDPSHRYEDPSDLLAALDAAEWALSEVSSLPLPSDPGVQPSAPPAPTRKFVSTEASAQTGGVWNSLRRWFAPDRDPPGT